MTDKELLELAAKAAGIDASIWHDEMEAYWISYNKPQYWNPLTDDGDALRLAVKLQLEVNHDMGFAVVRTPEPLGAFSEIYRNDPYASTRRAIVRAAAAIGETK